MPIPAITDVRPFIGTRQFADSHEFYLALGCTQVWCGADRKLCLLRLGSFHFYLQDYYKRTWLENTRLFVEVPDVAAWHRHIVDRQLPDRYPFLRYRPPQLMSYGARELSFLDPGGVLWQFATFEPEA